MTCIVATKTDKGVMMGADSCAGRDHRASAVTQPKIAMVGEYLIGYTSSFRIGQVLHHALATSKHNEKDDILAHLINSVVPEIRNAFRNAGCLHTNNGIEQGGQFLLAHGTRLFTVQSDFSVLEYADDYAACGCGEEWAMGAMFAIKDLKESASPDYFLRVALEAATKYSAYVKPPYHFVRNYKGEA